MNGIVELNVKGKKHILRYGYQACMEFEARSFKNATENATQNSIKIISDIIYSGLYGEALRNEKPIPTYSFACDIIDSLMEEENCAEQMDAVWEAFNQSKWGADYMKRIAELTNLSKKKGDANLN